jgi:hypothetical protein
MTLALQKNRRPEVDRVRFLTPTSSSAKSTWAVMSVMIIQLLAPPSERSEVGDRIRRPGWLAVTDAENGRAFEETNKYHCSTFRRPQLFSARTELRRSHRW